MINSVEDYINWLDVQLAGELPKEIIAFNINIYESPFLIELTGSKDFDVQDDDWACNEDWVPENRSIAVAESLFGESWEVALENLIEMSQSYLNSAKINAHKLKTAKAFSIGFVEGDLFYLVRDGKQTK